jgi:phosphoglycolate phosphatase
VSELKPDPAGLRLAVDRLGSGAADVVYVGDSVVDAEAATRADVAFVAVLSGVTPKGAFRPYRTYSIIEDSRTLPDILKV